MTDTPILDRLLADPKFEISPWLGTEFEPWPDPWVVLPPSPQEARRVMAQRAGWDTAELDARAIRALSLVDAERTVSLITIEPAPEPEPEQEPEPEEEPATEPEPEVVEVPPGVDEFLDDPDTGVTRERKEKDNVDE